MLGQRVRGSRHGIAASWLLRLLTLGTNQSPKQADGSQAVFYALQRDLGLHLQDLATMTLIQACVARLFCAIHTSLGEDVTLQGVTTSAVAPFWGILADRGIMKRRCGLSSLIDKSYRRFSFTWMYLYVYVYKYCVKPQCQISTSFLASCVAGSTSSSWAVSCRDW